MKFVGVHFAKNGQAEGIDAREGCRFLVER